MGKPTPGVSSSVSGGESNLASSLGGLLAVEGGASGALQAQALPAETQAIQQAEVYASGDPFAIARATAPAAQQISEAASGARQNIMQNAPAGGAKNLALENVSVQQAGQVGNIASQGYLGAFNTEGQLGAQLMGQSQNALGLGITSAGEAGNLLATQGSQQLQAQQMQIEQKGQTIGAATSLVGDAATLGAAAIGGGDGGGGGKGPQSVASSNPAQIQNQNLGPSQYAGWFGPQFSPDFTANWNNQ